MSRRVPASTRGCLASYGSVCLSLSLGFSLQVLATSETIGGVLSARLIPVTEQRPQCGLIRSRFVRRSLRQDQHFGSFLPCVLRATHRDLDSTPLVMIPQLCPCAGVNRSSSDLRNVKCQEWKEKRKIETDTGKLTLTCIALHREHRRCAPRWLSDGDHALGWDKGPVDESALSPPTIIFSR